MGAAGSKVTVPQFVVIVQARAAKLKSGSGGRAATSWQKKTTAYGGEGGVLTAGDRGGSKSLSACELVVLAGLTGKRCGRGEFIRFLQSQDDRRQVDRAVGG